MYTHRLTRQIILLFVGTLCLLATGCATRSSRFEFGVIGDVPYRLDEEARVAAAITDMNRSDLAFVIHVGDIQADPRTSGASPTCTDASLQRRKELFDASRHPLILTPGDNEWTDCHLIKDRMVDPLERLARLRAVFFPSADTLGQRKMTLTVQAEPRYAKYVENRLWTHNGVLFVTVHNVGSNNNRGRTPDMDAEYTERNAANLTWLAQAFERAQKEQARAVVIFTQANPQFETTWSAGQVRRYLYGLPVNIPQPRQPTGFDDFLAALERDVVAFGRPVVLIHGDTHIFRIDKPLFRTAENRFIENFTRMETFGSPDVHWIRVIVDLNDPGIFFFRPEFIAR